MSWEVIMIWAGHLDLVIGLVGSIAAIAAWIRLKAFDRLDEPVEVKLALATGGREVVLPLAMRRRDVTRAELLGRLAMFVRGGGRMSLAALSDPATLGRIDAVTQGRASTLILPCTEEELAQFNLD